jgi:hypothetical protein
MMQSQTTSDQKLEYIKQWRARNREKVLSYQKRYYRKNKEKYAKWKADNPDKVKASYAKNSAKSIERAKLWSQRNKHRVNEWRRVDYKKHTETISPYYVRKLIARRSGWSFATKLPVSFIKAKQAHIKLVRLCQNQQTLRS